MSEPDSHPYDIPYLRTLRDRLWSQRSKLIGTRGGSDVEVWASLRVLDSDLEQLPYTLQGAYESAVDLAVHQESLLECLDNERKLEMGVIYLIPERDRNALGYRLDTFVEIGRRCQDAAVLYMNRALGLQLPSSFRACAEKLSADKLNLPGEVARLLQDYWTDCGQTLRDYRDLSQHHLLLSSDAQATRDSSGTACLYLVLPNNPAEKSMRKLAFADPVVHALPYVIRAYQDLYRFCFHLAVLLLAQTGEVVIGPWTLSLLPRIPFGGAGSQSIQWIEPLRISGSCWQLRQRLEQHVKHLLANEGQGPPVQER